MTEENSLLLFVDVKDILNQEVELDNTNSWDSSELINKQVGNNLIKNSWVLYNNIINNRIEKEIDNRVPYIEDIECNEYNENEYIISKIVFKRKTFVDFKNYVISKYGNTNHINLELFNILDKTSKEYFEKQQQTTTKTINYNGRKPKTFVLKRLETIGKMLSEYDTVIFSNIELKQIIKDALDNPDDRTINLYYDCMIDYAKQNGRIRSGMYEVRLNMRGFLETVRNIRDEKYAK